MKLKYIYIIMWTGLYAVLSLILLKFTLAQYLVGWTFGAGWVIISHSIE